jgi:ABC-type glycerol-3-phosphate transport system substrate-binding protein
MYKIFMLIAVPALIIAWVAYALWERKMRAEEAEQPKQISQRLKQTKNEVADYAQKLKDFKKPTRKQPDQDDQA